MIGTFFSIAVAIFLYLNPVSADLAAKAPYLGGTLFVVAALFVVIQTLITVFSWAPLQREQQNSVPRLMEAFKKDRHLRFSNFFILVFLLFTFLVYADVLILNYFNKTQLLMAWVIALGVALDFLHHLVNRVMDFLDPSHVIEFYGQSALSAVRGSREVEILEWIDAISETALKAVDRSSTSLAFSSIEKLRLIAHDYLQVAKGISFHKDREVPGGASTGAHVSYTLFYLFQRLELVYDKALKERLEPVLSELITVLGKITIYCAKFDMSMTPYPIHYIGKLSQKANQKGLHDLINRSSLTLLEVSRVILTEVDLKYMEIKDPFLSIVNYMHENAKNNFRRDKTMEIKLLTQPFVDLKGFFKAEKIAGHQDAPAILRAIDAVLEEFRTLEAVLSTMPPIDQIVKERQRTEEEAAEKTEETETK